MDFFELLPKPVEIILNGEAFELAPFSLCEMVWCAETYATGDDIESGVNFLFSVLSGESFPFDLVAELTYHLMLDKDSYPSICRFKTAIRGTPEKPLPTELTASIMNGFYKALVLNISNSQPIQKEKEEDKTGKKTSAGSRNKKTNWESIYVDISREIGYTLKEFYALTLRQIFGIHDEILRQKHNDLLTLARLNGTALPEAKYKTLNENESSFSPEVDERLTASIERIVKEKGKINA